jgi:hypothetical protein
MGLVMKYFERRYERMSPEEKAAADAEMARRTEIAAGQIEAAHAAQAASLAAQEQSRAEHQARLDAEVLGGPAGAAVHGAVPSGPQPGVLDQIRDTARALTSVSGLLGVGSGFAPGISDHAERARVQASVSYRDRPEYAEGRHRWRAYQDNVLFARMHLKTSAHRVIADEFEGVAGGGALRALSQVGRVVDRVTSFTTQPDHFRVNLRYCQPLER